MGRETDRQPVQRLVEKTETDSSWFRSRECSGAEGQKGFAGEIQMMKNNIPKKHWMRLLVPVSSLALVIVFFLAPIIPLNVSYSCPPPTPSSVHYTDWQSPSYYLFQIGYHYTTQQPMCFGG